MLTLLASLAAAASLTAEPIDLPGGPPVGMDYLVFDASTGHLWIPASNTAKVDVLDTKSGKLEAIEGFATKKTERWTMGPTAGTAGADHVYIGNRADQSICAYDSKTREKKGCATVHSQPDGVFYVAPTHEVWVTTPRDKSIAVLSVKDAGKPAVAHKIAFDGEPEGYVVDDKRGIAYTNLEDKDVTLAIDAKTRKTLATWKATCGEKGPRGLALDGERRHLFVACGAGGVKVLDAGKDGAVIGELKTGAGVDNIDYLEKRHLLYAASGKEGTLTIAEAKESGALEEFATAKTVVGGRTVIIDADGTGYIPDSKGGKLWKVKLPEQ
jgi:outer membrane protein assembly factor BamB